MKIQRKSRSTLFCLGLVAFSTTTLLSSVAAIAENCTQSKASSTLVAGKMTSVQTTGTIVEVASANGSFKTLVAAIQAAGLVETLSGKGPFTVFAPTDKAFEALPKGVLADLLKPENKAKLQKILTYHVVAGEVTSKMIKPGEVKTVEGSPLKISFKSGKVMVGPASVVLADVDASNGVIHVINEVLLPPNL